VFPGGAAAMAGQLPGRSPVEGFFVMLDFEPILFCLLLQSIRLHVSVFGEVPHLQMLHSFLYVVPGRQFFGLVGTGSAARTTASTKPQKTKT